MLSTSDVYRHAFLASSCAAQSPSIRSHKLRRLPNRYRVSLHFRSRQSERNYPLSLMTRRPTAPAARRRRARSGEYVRVRAISVPAGDTLNQSTMEFVDQSGGSQVLGRARTPFPSTLFLVPPACKRRLSGRFRWGCVGLGQFRSSLVRKMSQPLFSVSIVLGFPSATSGPPLARCVNNAAAIQPESKGRAAPFRTHNRVHRPDARSACLAPTSIRADVTHNPDTNPAGIPREVGERMSSSSTTFKLSRVAPAATARLSASPRAAVIA